jgi:hypothetical protein
MVGLRQGLGLVPVSENDLAHITSALVALGKAKAHISQVQRGQQGLSSHSEAVLPAIQANLFG